MEVIKVIIDAKAAELRKTESSLTKEQAFEKVYTDPVNRHLVTAYKQEQRANQRDASIQDADKSTLSKASINNIAEMLCTAHGMDMPGALRYLFHDQRGRALLRSVERHTSDGVNPNPDVVRSAIADQMELKPQVKIPNATENAIAKTAKQIVEDGTTSLSEAQFTKLVKTQAQIDRLADETPEQAFAKYFSAGTEESRLVREAYRIARRTAA